MTHIHIKCIYTSNVSKVEMQKKIFPRNSCKNNKFHMHMPINFVIFYEFSRTNLHLNTFDAVYIHL
jgi:hypothetical protein